MDRRTFLISSGGVLGLGAAGTGLSFAAMGSMSDYAAYAAKLRAPLGSDPSILDLLRHATLAANGHNTQPWRFRLGRGAIAIEPDRTRRTPVVDPDDHHLFVSLGCAAANLELAAAAAGLHGEVDLRTDAPVLRFTPGEAKPGALAAAIPKRQSTRSEYDVRPVPVPVLRQLERAAAVPGVSVALVTARRAIDRIGTLIRDANRRQLVDPAFRRELRSWLRFTPYEAQSRGDGLFSAASGNPTLPPWIGRRAFDLFYRADADDARYARQIAGSAGLAVFVGAGATPADWTRTGMACQRFLLQATALGLRCAFVNQPVEVAELRPALAAAVGMAGHRPDLIVRFGYAPPMPWSPRRPIEAVIAA